MRAVKQEWWYEVAGRYKIPILSQVILLRIYKIVLLNLWVGNMAITIYTNSVEEFNNKVEEFKSDGYKED